MHFRRSFAKLEVLAHVSSALEALHEHNILHRDLKPENILMDSTGDSACPKLTDFDQSKDMFGASHTTSMIHAFGTPGYAAPELSSNRPTYSKASDMYALGATGVFVLVYNGNYAEVPNRAFPQQGPDLHSGLVDVSAALGQSKELKALWETVRAQLHLALSSNVNARPSAKALGHAFKQRMCFLCCEEDAMTGIACPAGLHFTCNECLVRQVDTVLKDATKLPGVSCLECKDDKMFAEDDLWQLLPPALRQSLAEKQRRYVQQHAHELGMKEGQAQAEARQKQSTTTRFRQKLETEVMQLTCPGPGCGIASQRVEGCLTLICPAHLPSGRMCNTRYCSICRWVGATNEQVHEHCDSCEYNPEADGNGVFCTERGARVGRRLWRKHTTERLLERLGDERRVVERDEDVRRLLREVGIAVRIDG
jgi:hypothetical protein